MNATYHKTPNSGDLVIKDSPVPDGAALTDVKPLDTSLYDSQETGPMFFARYEGSVLHLFANEVQF